MMSDTAVLLLSILAAVIPTLLYVGIIYWIDRYEKEPWWLLTAAFLWGAIPSIIIAYVVNTLFTIPFYYFAGNATGETLAAAFVAPPVEESVKGLALLIIFWRWRHEIDSLLDGIIYGAIVGMGFAMVENVFYFVNTFAEGGLEAWSVNIFVRSLVFGLNHALFTSMTGLGIAVARMSRHSAVRLAAPVMGWGTAVFLHFLHNLTVSSGSLLCIIALIFDWGGVLLTLLIMVWALLQEQRWIRTYLAEEVGLGVLTMRQYETASSGRKRGSHRFQLLTSRGFLSYRAASRFYYKCAELAYKKHHYTLFQDEKSGSLITQLRGEVAYLSQELL
ncbi:MAG: PrsW family intramembrane metalloprotease [Ardenticatenaceae bacterium]|nr:PrsW family intramembrane metalloprotease [Anaerolineales bacterium]MCB8920405.1 PrsW family intramembrane metalloprotease [Ardenticatenaceae bacterium]MCB8989360.1 PrsW family intramembrane metalloprotease [Ardenticatenaceae bacterium]MCB9004515.1 PrsW family intramembrane metalloprotease [Ardenticatenaceae bacterium]